MIEWREEGIALAVRRHGEADAILEVLTPGHGRHAGVVRGGGGRRLAPLMQPGAGLSLCWRARLEDHLGHFTVEPVQSRAALLADPLALSGLSALTAILAFALPEREAMPGVYEASLAVIALMEEGAPWPLAYLRWEMGLLERLGYGLDLGRCAVTGATRDLAFVSPRSGRAVSRAGAGDWAERLLPLPGVLRDGARPGPGEISEGLRVTGHFLDRRLAAPSGRALPAARARLLTRLAREGA